MKRAEHIPMTEKQYRSTKRKQANIVRRAMTDLNLGAAYLPFAAKLKFSEASNAINAMLAECRPWWKHA